MPTSTNRTILRIGAFRFDPSSHELWQDAVCIRLPRRLSLLLFKLAQTAPEVVTRQALIDDVWQRKMVEDDVLSRAVAELRKALGDDTKTPRYIETIPKTGYRMCAVIIRESLEASIVDEPVPQQSTNRVEDSTTGRAALSMALRHWPALLVALLVMIASGLRVLSQRQQLRLELNSTDLARQRPLTSEPGWEMRPALSSDGQWIAYARSAVGGGPSQIVLQDIMGNYQEVLEEAPQYNSRPAFAPDGRNLVFLHGSAGRCELRLRTIPGAPGRPLAPCDALVSSTPAWSEDQLRIVFTAPAVQGSSAGLSELNLSDGSVKALTRPSLTEGPDRDPEWVPGNNAVTFARGFEGDQRLLWLDVDQPTQKPTELVNGGRMQGHAWRSDGKQLLVATDQPGYRTLVRYAADGGVLEVLNTRGARYPEWAGNGEVVFELAQYDANIWKVMLQDPSAQPVAVVASTRYDASPTLSDDGSKLAFVSTRNDFEQVFISASDGSNPVRLPLPDGQRWSRPAFSPDASALLVAGYDERNRHWIYHHDLASGRTEQLHHLGEEASAGRFGRDGDSVVFMRRTPDGARSLWQGSVQSTSEATLLTGSEGVAHFDLGDDFIVLSYRQRPGFRLLGWSTRTPSKDILHEVLPIAEAAWAVRGRHLYAVIRDHGKNVLYRWDIDSGKSERMRADLDADAVGPALVVSPDESSVWFARTDSLSMDLMRVPATAR